MMNFSFGKVVSYDGKVIQAKIIQFFSVKVKKNAEVRRLGHLLSVLFIKTDLI